jgi:hypothetical protein
MIERRIIGAPQQEYHVPIVRAILVMIPINCARGICRKKYFGHISYMNQDFQKRRKRTVNFTVGAILAALHAAASANFLMNDSRFEWVSDSALMASVVKAGMIAGGAGLIVTLAALVLIKRAS